MPRVSVMILPLPTCFSENPKYPLIRNEIRSHIKFSKKQQDYLFIIYIKIYHLPTTH